MLNVLYKYKYIYFMWSCSRYVRVMCGISAGEVPVMFGCCAGAVWVRCDRRSGTGDDNNDDDDDGDDDGMSKG